MFTVYPFSSFHSLLSWSLFSFLCLPKLTVNIVLSKVKIFMSTTLSTVLFTCDPRYRHPSGLPPGAGWGPRAPDDFQVGEFKENRWGLSIPAGHWPSLQPGLQGHLGAIQTPGYLQNCLLLIDPWYQGCVKTYGFLLIYFTNRHIVWGAEKELGRT